jgi:23S rRNA A2030 N6-methylase RlmJ
MSNTDPESTLEQRIARLEELALAQIQGVMLSHHLNQMEQHKESLLGQPLIAADLTELSQKMQFTERQWERAKALSQQLTHELFQSVERRKGNGEKPNVVKLQPRRNNTRNSLIRADGKEYDTKESDQ